MVAVSASGTKLRPGRLFPRTWIISCTVGRLWDVLGDDKVVVLGDDK